MPYSKDECSCECVCVSTVLYCAVGITAVATFSAREGFLSPVRQERAGLWVNQPWEEAQCRVVAAGIANRGACPGDKYPPYNDLHINGYSECPGYTFCAYEGDDCTCEGQILFAPGLYGDYQMPDMTQATEADRHRGKLKCGVSSFDSDPAPGTSKACFCLSQELAALVQARGSLDEETCLKEGNTRYWDSGSAASPMLMLQETPLLANQGRDAFDEGVHDDEFLTEGVDIPQRVAPETENQLEVPDSYDSRRRGGCRTVLLPWALVEVSSESVFSRSLSTKRLRCAYEFGAEAVSRETTLSKADKRFQHFKDFIGNDMNCFTLGECIVGMVSPEELKGDEAVKGSDQLWIAAKVLVALCVVFSFCGFLGGKYGVRGFTWLDFLCYAILTAFLILVEGLLWLFMDPTPGSGMPTIGAMVFGMLCAGGAQCGLPVLIFNRLSLNSNDRPALVRQASGSTRFLLRHVNSARDTVLGPRPPQLGDHVRVVAAEQGLPADTEGYVAGIDGDVAVFHSDSGDMKRVAVNNLRVVA